MTGTPLEERFAAAVERLSLPEADLVGPVLDQLAAPGAAPIGRRGRPSVRRPPRVLAAAAVVLAVTIAAAVATPARRAVAGWLGIGATGVTVDPSPPARSPRAGDGAAPGAEPSAVPSAGALGRRLDAADWAGVDPVPSLGPPSVAFDHPARGRSYAWSATDPGVRGLRPAPPPLAGVEWAVVLSVRPVEGAGLAVKQVADAADVSLVEVPTPDGGRTGLWITDRHWLLAAEDAAPALAERVLLWEDGALELRLELAGELPAALALAAEVSAQRAAQGGGTDLLPPG